MNEYSQILKFRSHRYTVNMTGELCQNVLSIADSVRNILGLVNFQTSFIGQYHSRS